MKKYSILFIAAALVFVCFGFSFWSLPIGANIPKPDLKLLDISGKEISLGSAQKANGLLVMFSCNTCPVVIANQSRTQSICKYASSQNIGVVLLNSNEAARNSSESLEQMKSYASNQSYQWYYAVDKHSELADAFGANRTPECFLFDKSGKLVYHGAIDDNPSDIGQVERQHLHQAIDEMIANKPISIKETRSVGCSIKRS